MLDNYRDYNQPGLKTLGKNKLFWLFLFLSLAILALIFWYYKKQVLENPLALNLSEEFKAKILIDSETGKEKTMEELRAEDTDQDGLNDYQELYQFGTSIFLADTDSDGFSDSEEVGSGNDPICPSGQDCNLLRLITPSTKLADVVESVNFSGDLTLEEAALAEFRKFLLENGFSQAEVDKLTDDDLLYIFSILQESELAQDSLDANPGPVEVRNFLLSQPEADAETINALSDEELLKIRDQLTQF
jgi:hypothetical protein